METIREDLRKGLVQLSAGDELINSLTMIRRLNQEIHELKATLAGAEMARDLLERYVPNGKNISAVAYRDFGYANGWGDKEPGPVAECRLHPDHDRHETNHGIYGTNHTTVCHTCRIKWHVDSGD